MVLTLYHVPMSFPSRAALWVARAVGVDVDIKILNLIKLEHLKPEFIKINPQHTIPTLIDGDFVVWDSHAIAGYLVRKYAADDSLYPQDPKEKAIVDQRMFFDAELLFPRIRAICFPVIFLGKTTVDPDKKASVLEAMAFLDTFLEGNPWVAGKKLTIADYTCAASVTSIVEVGLNISAFKNVQKWLVRCQTEIPFYKEANEPGAKELGKYISSRLEPNQF